MLAFGRAIFMFFLSAGRSLIGANSESRNDFVAINNALESQIKRLDAKYDAAVERLERMQTQLDSMHGEVLTLRTENAELRAELAECNRRHDLDGQEITSLKARVRELESKSNGAMGS